MPDEAQFEVAHDPKQSPVRRTLRFGILGGLAVVLVSVLAAIFLQGLALTAFGDGLQTALTALAAILALQNIRKSHSRLRVFWLLFFSAALAWTTSNIIWSVQEVWLGHAAPDDPRPESHHSTSFSWTA